MTSHDSTTTPASPAPATPPAGARALERVRAALAPLAVAHGVSLVDVEWTTERGGRTLRVTIERVSDAPLEPGEVRGFGVSVDDCAEFSRDASQALDLLDGLDGAYLLEVSSPGLDRPLRTIADFRRFTGELAKVKLKHPAPDGQRVLRGALVSVADAGDAFSIEVDGKLFDVALTDVEAANLAFELTPQRKKVASPKKGTHPHPKGAKKGRSNKK
ncbi:MAG: ribosome maturation factor RimP [Polyangiaceae bacterium]